MLYNRLHGSPAPADPTCLPYTVYRVCVLSCVLNEFPDRPLWILYCALFYLDSSKHNSVFEPTLCVTGGMNPHCAPARLPGKGMLLYR